MYDFSLQFQYIKILRFFVYFSRIFFLSVYFTVSCMNKCRTRTVCTSIGCVQLNVKDSVTLAIHTQTRLCNPESLCPSTPYTNRTKRNPRETFDFQLNFIHACGLWQPPLDILFTRAHGTTVRLAEIKRDRGREREKKHVYVSIRNSFTFLRVYVFFSLLSEIRWWSLLLSFTHRTLFSTRKPRSK